MNTTIQKDLNLNLLRFLGESSLSPKEANLALLALSVSTENKTLAAQAKTQLTDLAVSEEEIREAAESAGIMGMLNMYYRFRHMVQHGSGAEAAAAYKVAGLRMTALAKPTLGKELFELLALAVSVLNGCETCIVSHEQVLRQAGVSTEKIHDVVRLAATVKGLKALEMAQSI